MLWLFAAFFPFFPFRLAFPFCLRVTRPARDGWRAGPSADTLCCDCNARVVDELSPQTSHWRMSRVVRSCAPSLLAQTQSSGSCAVSSRFSQPCSSLTRDTWRTWLWLPSDDTISLAGCLAWPHVCCCHVAMMLGHALLEASTWLHGAGRAFAFCATVFLAAIRTPSRAKVRTLTAWDADGMDVAMRRKVRTQMKRRVEDEEGERWRETETEKETGRRRHGDGRGRQETETGDRSGMGSGGRTETDSETEEER